MLARMQSCLVAGAVQRLNAVNDFHSIVNYKVQCSVNILSKPKKANEHKKDLPVASQRQYM